MYCPSASGLWCVCNHWYLVLKSPFVQSGWCFVVMSNVPEPPRGHGIIEGDTMTPEPCLTIIDMAAVEVNVMVLRVQKGKKWKEPNC